MGPRYEPHQKEPMSAIVMTALGLSRYQAEIGPLVIDILATIGAAACYRRSLLLIASELEHGASPAGVATRCNNEFRQVSYEAAMELRTRALEAVRPLLTADGQEVDAARAQQ